MMSKERLEEIEEHILKIDEDDSTNRSKMLDYRHWAYNLLKIANEQAERVQELESFKNSVEYTVDTETIELIVENQDSDVALSSVETYDEEIYFLKKRVEDNDQAIVDLNKHVEELEDENVDLEQQNKRYREALEFYAISGQGIGETKHGEVARKALEESE